MRREDYPQINLVKIKDPQNRLEDHERLLPGSMVEAVMSSISAMRYDSLRFKGDEGLKYKKLLLALRYFAESGSVGEETVPEAIRKPIHEDVKADEFIPPFFSIPEHVRLGFLFDEETGRLNKDAAAIIRAADIREEGRVDGIKPEKIVTFGNPMDMTYAETAKREKQISLDEEIRYHNVMSGKEDPMFCPRPDAGGWRSFCRSQQVQ